MTWEEWQQQEQRFGFNKNKFKEAEDLLKSKEAEVERLAKVTKATEKGVWFIDETAGIDWDVVIKSWEDRKNKMSYFKSWEDVERFMQIGCVSIENVGIFYGSGWYEEATKSRYVSNDLITLMKYYTSDDVSKIKLEWVGG